MPQIIPPRWQYLAVALVSLATAGGCRDLQGDPLENPGALEVLVTDQNDSPIFDVTVTLIQGGQNITRRTANNGVARWDIVAPGVRPYFVTPPSGYTGGGESNRQNVTIVSGELTRSTFKLQRSAP